MNGRSDDPPSEATRRVPEGTRRVPDPLERLIGELSRFPGVGAKTAARLAHHVLRSPRTEAEALATALLEVKDRLFHCSTCNAITSVDPCRICSDPQRDASQICVVQEPFNVEPIERTGEYRGHYHVLLGALSPQRGVGPDEIAIAGLLERLDRSRSQPVAIGEVIIATNPNVEGEATALYLARLLRGHELDISRLAFGLPVGGDLEYIDEVTLARSLAGRRPL